MERNPWIPRVALLLLFLAVLLQLRLWTSNSGALETERLRARVEAQRAENIELQKRNAALAADVEDLKNGKEAVEERARSELGMIKPGETFFQVVEPQAQGKSAGGK